MGKTKDETTVYWYTLKDVFLELRDRGIQMTWTRIKQYQEANLIPQFTNAVIFHKKRPSRGLNIFTQKDMDTLIEAIVKIKEEENRK